MSALTIVGAVTLDGEPTALRADDGTITALGADVVAVPGDEVLDARGGALIPGLVNGHTHAAMTLFRGYGSDLPLMRWLEERIWPAEARLTDDAVYWGTRLACLEMVRTGTTRFWDMYWRPAQVARAAIDAGVRATVGPPIIDGTDPARSPDACAEASATLDELAAGAHPLVEPSLCPHGTYTVSEPSLAWVAEESARRGIPVQLHLLETADERAECAARLGTDPVSLLARTGLLSDRLVLSHAVWTDDHDRARLADAGATVVTCPASNLKLAVGAVFPYPATAAAGVAVGLGTDGASSNNSLDLFQEVKLLALLQKHAADDPAQLTAATAWAIATGTDAPRLGATAIAVGAPADVVVLRADAPELAPGHVLDNLVYAAAGSVVAHTVVAGRVLMRDGVVDGADEVLARARECASALGVI